VAAFRSVVIALTSSPFYLILSLLVDIVAVEKCDLHVTLQALVVIVS
jgi:hypothetical protein